MGLSVVGAFVEICQPYFETTSDECAGQTPPITRTHKHSTRPEGLTHQQRQTCTRTHTHKAHWLGLVSGVYEWSLDWIGLFLWDRRAGRQTDEQAEGVGAQRGLFSASRSMGFIVFCSHVAGVCKPLAVSVASACVANLAPAQEEQQQEVSLNIANYFSAATSRG